MGRVSSTDFIERNIASTSQRLLYAKATTFIARFVLVRSTHLPSYRASAVTFAASIVKRVPCVLRKRRKPLLPTSALSPCRSAASKAATIASRSWRVGICCGDNNLGGFEVVTRRRPWYAVGDQTWCRSVAKGGALGTLHEFPVQRKQQAQEAEQAFARALR